MSRLLLVLLLLVPAAFAQSPPDQESPADQEDWIQLFNGENLDGWHPKIRGYALDDNFGDTFRVENGLMTVAYDAYDSFDERFGHIFYEKEYGYYRLRLEYRFVGDPAPNGPGWARRNSGIMVHGQPAHTMTKDQNFPISIEVQLLGGLGEGDRPTSNLCTPGTHVVMHGKLIVRHCTPSSSKTYDGDQWVSTETIVLGDALIEHYVEGDLVLSYNLPQIGGPNVDPVDPNAKTDGKLLERGSISLQSESHPVQFRKIELLNLEGCLDKKAKNYKSYFVKSLPGACRY